MQKEEIITLPVLELVSHTGTSGSDCTYALPKYDTKETSERIRNRTKSGFCGIRHFAGSGSVFQGLPIRIRDRSGLSGMKICIIIANFAGYVSGPAARIKPF
jgi:hypothetical protein